MADLPADAAVETTAPVPVESVPAAQTTQPERKAPGGGKAWKMIYWNYT